MNIGDHVAWQWANGLAQGIVKDIRTERVEIVSKGKKIVRNGSADNPALIIDHASGNPILKLTSEVQRTEA
jgi:hypothetical protein